MTQSIAVGRRVDASTVGRLRSELLAAVDAGSGAGGDGGDMGDIVLDVSSVQFVDGTGLAMLLGVRRHTERVDRRLVLRGTPRRLARLLRATRLDRILVTEEVDRPAAGPEEAPAA